MRKLIVIIALAGISFSVFAQQPKKGAILAGGSLGFNVNKYSYKDAVSGISTETNSAGFSLAPKVGITLSDGLIVGGILQFGVSSTKSGGASGKKFPVQT